MKEKGRLNFDIRICPICGKQFRCKGWEDKKYCTIHCAHIANQQSTLEASRLGSLRIREQYQTSLPDKIAKIHEWVKSNSEVVANTKMNNLYFLHDLAHYLGVQDVRTVAKMLGLKYRKELALKLIEISENIC